MYVRSKYTGIFEIDRVLVDLYNEQTLLEKALVQKPGSKVLVKRRKRVIELADHLMHVACMLNGLFDEIPENA